MSLWFIETQWINQVYRIDLIMFINKKNTNTHKHLFLEQNCDLFKFFIEGCHGVCSHVTVVSHYQVTSLFLVFVGFSLT